MGGNEVDRLVGITSRSKTCGGHKQGCTINSESQGHPCSTYCYWQLFKEDGITVWPFSQWGCDPLNRRSKSSSEHHSPFTSPTSRQLGKGKKICHPHSDLGMNWNVKLDFKGLFWLKAIRHDEGCRCDTCQFVGDGHERSSSRAFARWSRAQPWRRRRHVKHDEVSLPISSWTFQ